MPILIPSTTWNALSLAIARGDTDQVQHLVEENKLDVNACLSDGFWMPFLMEALLSSGFSTESQRLPLLHYLLEKGANPNICCSKGYNCLHIAVQQQKYIHAMDLFLDFDADVNVTDADGSSAVYWAIQAFLLRKEDPEERALSLRVLEKMLWRGADLDQKNRYDMSARAWLDHAAPEVKKLVAMWEAGNPGVRPAYTIQPKFSTPLSSDRQPVPHRRGLVQKMWRKLRGTSVAVDQ